jgi:Tol biopolymer transport system component
MMMKKILMLATVVLLLALGAGTALAQSGYDLFQKALVKERAVGDVEEALRLYQRIVKEFGGNHALAAKAQLRMGLLYDRLGRKADAQRAYQAVANQYADQTNEARQARAKIVVAAAPRNIKPAAKTTTGLTVRQVWTGVGEATAISRDGRYLAYVGGGEGALSVRDLYTGEDRRLTVPDADRPIFSPDGKSIAYRCNKCANRSRDEIRLIALDGSAPRVLNVSYDGPVLFPIEWSLDGKHILAGATSQNGNRQLVFVSVADGSAHVVMTLEELARYGGVALSPDGRYIAYAFAARKGSTERDIFLLSTDGGVEVPLVTQPADDRNPVWTPDGGGVLFLSTRAGSTGAWFLRVVDGKPQGSPELVKRDVGQIVPIGFTRNGSLYYKEESEMPELYTATLDPTSGTITGQPTTVTQRLVVQQGESWSPNGQYLAYSSRRSFQGETGTRIIVIRSVQTGEEYELAPALRDFDLQDWSPDSRSLLVTGRDTNGREGAYRVDARTGDVALLAVTATTGFGYDTANWLGNGKSIVFRRGEAAQRQIVERDLETGHETEWYRAPASLKLYYVEASADGRYLAFILRDPAVRIAGASLMVMTAAGEKPRKLDLRLKGSDEVDSILGFTPDGRHVLFNSFDPKQKDRGYKYWRIAVEGGGDPQEIRLPMGRPVYIEQMSFHPDGRQIAFTTFSLRSSSKSAVWVMENFLPTAQTKKTTASRR